MSRRKRNSGRTTRNEASPHIHGGTGPSSDQDTIGEKFTFAQSDQQLDTDGKNLSELLSSEVSLHDSNSINPVESEFIEAPDKLENAFNQGDQPENEEETSVEKLKVEETTLEAPQDIEAESIDQALDQVSSPNDVPIAIVASGTDVNEKAPEDQAEKLEHENSELIGDYLNRHREIKGLSLKYISQQTKVGLSKLEMLEKNNLDGLPDKAYVTGYVKILSKILSLNEREALEILNQTYKNLLPIEENQIASPPIKKSSSAAPLVILGVLGIVIFLVTTFFLKKHDETNEVVVTNTEVKKEAAPTEENVEGVAKINSNTTPDSIVESEVSISPSEKAALSNPENEENKAPLETASEPKPEELETIEKANLIDEPSTVEEVKKDTEEDKKEVTFRKLTKRLYEIDTEATKKVTFDGIPANLRTSGIAGKQNLVIAATKSDAWMTLKTDDNPVKKVILKKGKTLYLSASEIRLFIGNLDGIKLILNGNLVKVVSKNGVKSLVFPQENRKNYHLPLFIFQENGKVQTSDEYIEENKLDI